MDVNIFLTQRHLKGCGELNIVKLPLNKRALRTSLYVMKKKPSSRAKLIRCRVPCHTWVLVTQACPSNGGVQPRADPKPRNCSSRGLISSLLSESGITASWSTANSVNATLRNSAQYSLPALVHQGEFWGGIAHSRSCSKATAEPTCSECCHLCCLQSSVCKTPNMPCKVFKKAVYEPQDGLFL